jgi:hypothetical protein
MLRPSFGEQSDREKSAASARSDPSLSMSPARPHAGLLGVEKGALRAAATENPETASTALSDEDGSCRLRASQSMRAPWAHWASIEIKGRP